MTLERQIYSIEAANINKETLDTLKNASDAMKRIHGSMTIDKVDQVMYVPVCPEYFPPLLTNIIGRILTSNTASPMRSVRLSPRTSAHRSQMKMNLTRSWRLCSKRNLTTRCLEQEPCQSIACQTHQKAISRRRHQREYSNKKRTTRRKSSESYKPRWLCNRAPRFRLSSSSFAMSYFTTRVGDGGYICMGDICNTRSPLGLSLDDFPHTPSSMKILH